MIVDTPTSANDSHVNIRIATPASTVAPVSGKLLQPTTPCKFHIQNRCNRGDQCRFAHPNPTATAKPNNVHKARAFSTPTQTSWNPCSVSVHTGTCRTNMAPTTAVGEACAKPKAKSKTNKLRLGAVPGKWVIVDHSRGPGHGLLDSTAWTIANSIVQASPAQTFTGPRFFPPRLVGNTNSTEGDSDREIDTSPVGNLTASSSTTDASRTKCCDQIKAHARGKGSSPAGRGRPPSCC